VKYFVNFYSENLMSLLQSFYNNTLLLQATTDNDRLTTHYDNNQTLQWNSNVRLKMEQNELSTNRNDCKLTAIFSGT